MRENINDKCPRERHMIRLTYVLILSVPFNSMTAGYSFPSYIEIPFSLYMSLAGKIAYQVIMMKG